MKEEDGAFLKYIEFIQKNKHSYWALIVVWGIEVIVFDMVFDKIKPHAINATQYFSINFHVSYNYLMILALIFVISFYFWFKMRSVPRFCKKQLGVIFAPNFDTELEKDIQKIERALKREIKKCDGEIKSVIKRLPCNIPVYSALEASKILKTSKASVVIWCNIDAEKKDNNKVIGFPQISFTWSGPNTEIARKILVGSNVGMQTTINDSTLILDVDSMGIDIGLITRNIIAVKFMNCAKWKDAVAFFRVLYEDYKSRLLKRNNIHFKAATDRVGYCLAFSLSMLRSYEYQKYFENKQIFSIPERFLRQWLLDADIAIKLDPTNSTHYINQGLFLFLTGDVSSAINADLKALKNAVNNEIVCNSNLALGFLYNFQGNCIEFLKYYSDAFCPSKHCRRELIIICMNFISLVMAKYPQKKQIFMALAILELERDNKKQAYNILKEFIDGASDDFHLNDFIIKAKKLMRLFEEKGYLNSDSKIPWRNSLFLSAQKKLKKKNKKKKKKRR